METALSLRSNLELNVIRGKRTGLNTSSVRVLTEDAPFSHGFLGKDMETSQSRSLYFKVVSGTLLLVLTYVIWGVLPIYWGSVYNLYNHAHNLHGWVVVSARPILPSLFRSDNSPLGPRRWSNWPDGIPNFH